MDKDGQTDPRAVALGFTGVKGRHSPSPAPGHPENTESDSTRCRGGSRSGCPRLSGVSWVCHRRGRLGWRGAWGAGPAPINQFLARYLGEKKKGKKKIDNKISACLYLPIMDNTDT